VVLAEVADEQTRLFLGDEIRFELECLLADISLADGRVTHAWKDAKRGRVSIMAAATLTSTAAGLISSAYHKFEANNPAINGFEDFWGCTTSLLENVGIKAYTLVSEPSLNFLWRLSNTATCLMRFKTAFWENGKPKESNLLVRDGYFGPAFKEDLDPIRALIPNDWMRLFMYELPRIYNVWLAMKQAGADEYAHAFPRLAEHAPCCFFSYCTEYFSTGKITAPLVFVFTFWLQSVLQTQGSNFVARCGTLTKMHARTLTRLYTAATDNSTSDPVDQWVFDKDFARWAELESWKLKTLEQQGEVYCRNPWAAGAAIAHMSSQCMFHGINVLSATLRLRTVCHLYSMLRQQDLLGPIRTLDLLIKAIGEQQIFPAGRGEPGKYFTTFQMAANMTAAAANKLNQAISGAGRPLRAPRSGIGKKREGTSVANVLLTARLLTGDVTILTGELEGCENELSIGALLDKVRDQLSDEHTLRTLGLDCFAVHELCGTSLCAVLGTWPGLREEYEVKQAAGGSADGRNEKDHDLWCLDEILHHTMLLEVDKCLTRDLELPAVLRERLKEAGSAMRLTWEAHQDRLFVLPESTDWHTAEFGPPPKAKAEKENKLTFSGGADEDTNAFDDAMDLLEEASGPLSPAEERRLKQVLRGRPGATQKHSVCSAEITRADGGARMTPAAMAAELKRRMQAQTDPDQLSTLMHQLAAGPAAEPLLLEWVLRSGGSGISHNGRMNQSYQDDGITAAHCAAGAGNEECLRTLWQWEGNCVHRKDKQGMTPLHFAAAGGHARICSILVGFFGADPRAQDRSERTAAQLAAECGHSELAKVLKRKEAANAADWARVNSHQPRDAELHTQAEERRTDFAARLANQQEGGAKAGSGSSGTGSTKKKGKKKKKGKAKGGR
jgi:hypothetical protein